MMDTNRTFFYKAALISIVFAVGIFVIFFGTSRERYDDYKPMIYLNEQLYGDSGEQVASLSEEWICTGEILQRTSSDAPMVKINYSSNCMDKGAAIFENERFKNCIYVKHEEKYILFEVLE